MTSRATIVVIEDEPAIRAGVVAGLVRGGYAVRECATFADGRRGCAADDVDLVLLDLVLPGGDGLDLLAWLRSTRPERPVLIMTARGSEADRVRGLKLGADDYVVKPFGLEELLARVEAVLRRAGVRVAPSGGRLTWPRGEIDFATRSARLFATPSSCAASASVTTSVTLSGHEGELLKLLAERRDRAVPREELLGLLWRAGATGLTSRAIDMTVLRLRDKLHDDPQQPQVIATVRGIGYRLVAQVQA